METAGVVATRFLVEFANQSQVPTEITTAAATAVMEYAIALENKAL